MTFLLSQTEIPESLLPRLRAVGEHYSGLAVRPGDGVDVARARAALAALYALARLPAPRQVFVARGPEEAARLAPSGSDEVQDRIKGAVLRALRPWGPELEVRWLHSRRMDADDAMLRRLREAAWPGARRGAAAGLGRVKWQLTVFAEVLSEQGCFHHPALSAWRGFLLAGVWDCLVLDDLAILCPPPASVSVDGEGRLHDDRRPCIRWDDGTRAWRVHGVPVPGNLIENPAAICVGDVLHERNAEVRRVLVSLMGMERFLVEAGARVRHEDLDGARMPRRLLHVTVPWEGEVNAYVEVTCPSTGHRHYLRVPPDVSTCGQAVAWTFGLEPATYKPLIEA